MTPKPPPPTREELRAMLIAVLDSIATEAPGAKQYPVWQRAREMVRRGGK